MLLVAFFVLCAVWPSGSTQVTVHTEADKDFAFRTVAEAQQHVRSLRAAGASSNIVINLGEGVYAPFTIGPQDSGLSANARTIYRGNGADTRISGGTVVPSALFKTAQSFPAVWELHITDTKSPSRMLSINGTCVLL